MSYITPAGESRRLTAFRPVRHKRSLETRALASDEKYRSQVFVDEGFRPLFVIAGLGGSLQ
jgi:hypothetical protein